MSVFMKYKGLDSILNRDMAIVCSKEVIEKYSPYLQELVNYAVELLGRCSISANRQGGTPFSPISIFRNSIQMADGIEILLSQATHSPCLLLMRNLFEAELFLAYMFKEKYEERSAAWLVWSRLREIKFLESLNPNDKRKSDFKDSIQTSEHASFVRPVANADSINNELKLLRHSLNKDKFTEIVNYFQNDKNRQQHWYQVFDGPSNLRCLAKTMGRLLEHTTHCKMWSQSIHVQNREDLIIKTKIGRTVRSIRSTPYEIKDMYINAGSYLIRISEHMGAKFRPEEPILDRQRDIIRRHRPEAFNEEPPNGTSPNS